MSRFSDRNQRNTDEEPNSWRSGNGSSTGPGYSSGGRNRYQDRPSAIAEERPSYMKLNLLPKGQSSSEIPVSATTSATSSTVEDDGGDKWSKVFKEPTRRPNFGSGDARLERSNEGGNENRGGGGFDRGGNRGRGYGGDRGDRNSRGNNNIDDSEIMNDPRFAGKFSSSSSGSGHQRQGGDRRNREDRPDRSYGGGGRSYGDSRSYGGGGYQSYNNSSNENMPLPTAPRSSLSSAPATQPLVPLGPTPAELKAIEDAKAAKAAKKLEREEAERKAKEAKEAAALLAQEKLEKEKTEHAIALAAAADAIATGLKGNALLVHVKNVSDPKPSGGALLKEILSTSADIVNSKWWTAEEYGEVLISLLQGVVPAQVTALYAVQAYCHEKKFPKVEVKGVTRKLIEYIFTLLLTSNIIDPEGYLGWADDENLSEVGGRVDAIVQTTTFIHSIRELDVEEFDEEEEEVDAPRQTVR